MASRESLAETRREVEERLFALDAERDRLRATLRALEAQERLGRRTDAPRAASRATEHAQGASEGYFD